MGCKEGYKNQDGKCVKNNKKSKETLMFGTTASQRFGLFLMALSFFIWYIRPIQNCSWWNVVCLFGSVTVSPIYMIATIALLAGGILFTLKLDKIIFALFIPGYNN